MSRPPRQHHPSSRGADVFSVDQLGPALSADDASPSSPSPSASASAASRSPSGSAGSRLDDRSVASTPNLHASRGATRMPSSENVRITSSKRGGRQSYMKRYYEYATRAAAETAARAGGAGGGGGGGGGGVDGEPDAIPPAVVMASQMEEMQRAVREGERQRVLSTSITTYLRAHADLKKTEIESKIRMFELEERLEPIYRQAIADMRNRPDTTLALNELFSPDELEHIGGPGTLQFQHYTQSEQRVDNEMLIAAIVYELSNEPTLRMPVKTARALVDNARARLKQTTKTILRERLVRRYDHHRSAESDHFRYQMLTKDRAQRRRKYAELHSEFAAPTPTLDDKGEGGAESDEDAGSVSTAGGGGGVPSASSSSSAAAALPSTSAAAAATAAAITAPPPRTAPRGGGSARAPPPPSKRPKWSSNGRTASSAAIPAASIPAVSVQRRSASVSTSASVSDSQSPSMSPGGMLPPPPAARNSRAHTDIRPH